MTYTVTVRDGIRMWCPACEKERIIYIDVTAGWSQTCCSVCQRIVRREAVPSTPFMTPEEITTTTTELLAYLRPVAKDKG